MATEQHPGNTEQTQSSRPRRRLLLRIGVVVGLVLVVAVGALAVFIIKRLNEPPIELSVTIPTAEATVEITAQAASEGDIPFGIPLLDLTYMSNRAGNWDVFVLDTDGVSTNITPGDFEYNGDYFPSWSFAGDMLNFITNRTQDPELAPAQVNPTPEDDGTFDVRTLTVAQAIITLFRDGRLDWDPNWSIPDETGRQTLAWVSLRDLNLEIYVGDANADNYVQLTDDGANGPRDWFMVWSPDGQKIAFASDRLGNDNIYVMDRDGSNIVQLTDDPARELRPVWSADGQQILFVSEREHLMLDGQMDLWVMNADGSNQHLLGEDEVFTGNYLYTPGGAQILYMSNEEGDWNIYLMNADGTNVRRLTLSDSDDLFPVWRPVPAEQAEQ